MFRMPSSEGKVSTRKSSATVSISMCVYGMGFSPSFSFLSSTPPPFLGGVCGGGGGGGGSEDCVQFLFDRELRNLPTKLQARLRREKGGGGAD